MLLFRQPHARPRVLLSVRLFSSQPSAPSGGPRRYVTPANDDASSPTGMTSPTRPEVQTARYPQRFPQRFPPSNARSAFVPSAQLADIAHKKDALMQDRQEQDARTPDAHTQGVSNQDAHAEDEQAQDVQVPDAYATGSVCEKTVERLSRLPFSPEVTTLLQAPLTFDAVAAKPTGKGMPPVPYLPEIRYRRILNKAFGAGAWTLLPAGPVRREGTVVSRDYQMFVFGRLVSEARGYQEFFHKGKTADVAVEGIKSNALMRCCKDLGIASELWDPDWIREWQSRQPGAAANAPPAARFRDN